MKVSTKSVNSSASESVVLLCRVILEYSWWPFSRTFSFYVMISCLPSLRAGSLVWVGYRDQRRLKASKNRASRLRLPIQTSEPARRLVFARLMVCRYFQVLYWFIYNIGVQKENDKRCKRRFHERDQHTMYLCQFGQRRPTTPKNFENEVLFFYG